jgi:putative ATP-binding cassette transporter
MKLFELFRREAQASVGSLLFVAGLAGISNALVLAIINAAAEQASKEKSSSRMLLMFLIVISIYAVSQWRLMSTAATEMEKILDRLRVRLADKIRRCDLQPLEEMGRTLIYASIQKETTTISQSALMLIMSAQAGILIFFTAIYVAVLSMVAFVLTIVVTVILAFVHISRAKRLNADLHDTMRRENDLFDSLTHLLEGFKEVRINRGRSNDLFARFEQISHDAAEGKTRTQAQIARMFIFSQLSFYILLGVVVFLVPRFNDTYSLDVVKITTAVLFLVGPISSLVGTVPNIAMADAACENIADLEANLERFITKPGDRVAPLTQFQEISFDQVVFQYNDPVYGSTFTVGPISLTLRAGEVIFISGGNGSGKSTFLKLLTALYYPQQGVVRVDGKALSPETYDSYRSLFSTVFTDYHLFDRLYGLYDVPDEAIQSRLDLIEMSAKTRVVDSRFETLDLSGGQRKRIALLVSLLEDRPIFVFDEMAADQDPGFRRKFYLEILPYLKEQGKTVIAVTHDDKYFGDADRLLKMEEGRIVNNEHRDA